MPEHCQMFIVRCESFHIGPFSYTLSLWIVYWTAAEPGCWAGWSSGLTSYGLSPVLMRANPHGILKAENGRVAAYIHCSKCHANACTQTLRGSCPSALLESEQRKICQHWRPHRHILRQTDPYRRGKLFPCLPLREHSYSLLLTVWAPSPSKPSLPA